MGCLFTSPYSPFYYLLPKSEVRKPLNEDEPKVYSWDLRPKIDSNDYLLDSRFDETIIKRPGSINGMQFIIQNLQNCKVYLFDHMSQITIDDCKNCTFLIGPTKGSIFIRDCSDCNMAAICQQFRTRDCKRINTFLFCVTQPIIESSINMKFGCISINYRQLNDHIGRANISLFNNNWNSIHDFTPVPGETNYSFFYKNWKIEESITFPSEDIVNEMELSLNAAQSVVPYTIGIPSRPNNESCLVIIFRRDLSVGASIQQENQAKSFIQAINKKSELVIVQTKKFELSEHSAENVFGTKKFNSYLDKKPLIGIEINGEESISKCRSIVEHLGIDLVYVSEASPDAHHRIDSFYNCAEIQMAV